MQPPPPPPPPHAYHLAPDVGGGQQAQPTMPQQQQRQQPMLPTQSMPPHLAPLQNAPAPPSMPSRTAPVPPIGQGYAPPAAPSMQKQQSNPPPRFLGPPARMRGPGGVAAPPPVPPSTSFAAPVPPPSFQQRPPPQQQQPPSYAPPAPPPTTMMQQMSLQQQQRPQTSYHSAGVVPPPLMQQQNMMMRPGTSAGGVGVAPPPLSRPTMPLQLQPQMPPPQVPQQQNLRGGPATTMAPPPPPAFGGVTVAGGGSASTPTAGAAASRPFAPPGGPPQRIDPSQIPRPLASTTSTSSTPSASLAPIAHRTRTTQQEGDRHVPPPPTAAISDFPGLSVVDGGDASFRALRPTLHSVPRNRDLLKSVGVPLAVFVTPLAPPLPGDDAIPVLDFGEEGPPRCKRCRSYINPGFVAVDDGAAFWCNLCGEVSPAPPSYLGSSSGRIVGAVGYGGGAGDAELESALASSPPASPLQGLELERGTVEYVAPSSFRVREPRPPPRLFVIDASFGAGASGLTAASCRAAASAIEAISARAKEAWDGTTGDEGAAGVVGRGGRFSSDSPTPPSAPPPTLVAVASFGASGLHFYSFKEGSGGGGGDSLEPSILVVPDVDAPFAPASADLFVDVSGGTSSSSPAAAAAARSSSNGSSVAAPPSVRDAAASRRLKALLALLERIPALHDVGGVSSSSSSPNPSSRPTLADPAAPSGAALAAGAAALASVGGGRLHAFLGSVGSAGARAGALALPRRGGDVAGAGVASHHYSSSSFVGGGDAVSNSFDDAPPLQPPPDPWRALAEFAAERQVGVDVHLAPPAGTRADGAGARAAAALCSATGGRLHFHPRWAPTPSGVADDLAEEAVEAVGCGVGTTGGGGKNFEAGVAHGWEAVGRLRVSRGLEVLSYSGPCHRRTPLDVDFPCLTPSTTVVAHLGHEGSFLAPAMHSSSSSASTPTAVVQFACAFTHAATGKRRVRVHTLRLPLAESPAQAFRGADADAVLALAARDVAAALKGTAKDLVLAGGGVGDGGASSSSVVPAAAGLLLKPGSSNALSSSKAAIQDPSALPAAVINSSSGSAPCSSAPALPAAALAEAAAEALTKARERARGCIVLPLACYRERCASTAAGGQLILPEALKLAPLAALSLSKHPAVAARASSGGGGGVSSSSSPAPPQDARAASAASLARSAPASLARDLTPRLLPLHLLLEAVLGGGSGGQGGSGGGRRSLLAAAAALQPPPLSAESVDACGVYALVSDTLVVLHAGGRADPRLVDALGMHRSGSSNGGFVVKVPGSAASELLWEMVDELAFRRGARLTVRSTPPASSSQQPQQQGMPPQAVSSALARLLPEDRSAAGPSYVEYLCWLHRQIQKRLM